MTGNAPQRLAAPFRKGVRRSACLQNPLCPPLLPGLPGPGLQPQSPRLVESQHSCHGSTSRAGGEERPPRPKLRPPPAPRRSSGRRRRNEWRLRPDAHGNQMMRRQGPCPRGRRPLPPRKGTGCPPDGPPSVPSPCQRRACSRGRAPRGAIPQGRRRRLYLWLREGN